VFPAELCESIKLPVRVKFETVVVANVVVPVTTKLLVVVASTKILEVAIMLLAIIPPFKIELPLKILAPLKVTPFKVEEERTRLLPVPELKVPPLTVVLVKVLIVLAAVEVFKKKGV
jgi:hypothetical protein